MHGQNLRFYYPSFDAILNECEKFSYSNLIHENKENIFNKSINIQNVSFYYSNSTNKILANINLNIQKGETICFTGKNGSGKTTLLNLISGFFKPTEGKILIDDFTELFSSNKSWMKNLSYVQQNIFLLNCTIKENITSSNESTFDSNKFSYIDKILSLSKIFENMPNSLNTIVGNNEKILSGGQKQIISIARALYKNSELLVFDEANSALDKNSSLNLKNLLLELKGKKTIIFVTHEETFFKECFHKTYQILSGELILGK